jgi:uncharacterized protein (TIGR02646 family)
VIRINKPEQTPDKLLADGQKKRKAHCLSYTRNAKNYQSNTKKFGFDRSIYAHPSVKKDLIESQYGKCCFCEQIIYEDGDVEHFRPKQAYRQEKGQPLQRPGYYWLAYEWDNLYLACTACNQRHKENLFPLINPEDRATSHHDDVKKEKPIFIDPGKEDPENFIEFRGEFAVGFDEESRGQNTIQVLALNRTSLRESRKDKLKLLQSLSQILKSIDQNSQSIELIEELHQAKILLEQSILSKGEFSAAVKCSINNNFEFIL